MCTKFLLMFLFDSKNIKIKKHIWVLKNTFFGETLHDRTLLIVIIEIIRLVLKKKDYI